jgi:hypothetical protein
MGELTSTRHTAHPRDHFFKWFGETAPFGPSQPVTARYLSVAFRLFRDPSTSAPNPGCINRRDRAERRASASRVVLHVSAFEVRVRTVRLDYRGVSWTPSVRCQRCERQPIRDRWRASRRDGYRQLSGCPARASTFFT